MSKIEIKRLAGPSALDAVAALSALGKKTFAETFVGKSYYTLEIIEGYTETAFAPAVLREELQDPNVQYLALYIDDGLAGYAKVVERDAEPCVEHLRPLYLERIYLDKSYQRGGHGKRLLEAVYDEARAKGYEWLWLSVWEFNEPAVAFYLKNGFSKAGEWDWPYESRGVKYVDRDWIMAGPIPKL